MQVYTFFAALVLLPALCSLLCLTILHRAFRNALVLVATAIMATAAILLTREVVQSGGQLVLNLHEPTVTAIGWVVKAIDLAVLLYVIARGLISRRFTSPILAVIQLTVLFGFELSTHLIEPAAPVMMDYLSLTLLLLASIIGPIILVFAIGYMERHEAHLHLVKSKQPLFFAVLFLFLSVMNALAVSDNILWVYTFWEVTTLCSFLLISHDGTAEAMRNAFRTLDLNMLGGVAFLGGIIAIYTSMHTLSLSEIASQHLAPGITTGLFAVGIAALCFAGFTKSAQFPFQSWLLGAMVAPTPVSALLHSSTMVKAGVYLVVRLSPVFAGSMLGTLVAIAGGFTFLAASAIAISQRNGKRVLAYSTIANLGLIICCAGIGTQAALGAGILLIIFHAISKGLLFLCIGTIEQGIDSRDIEDMQGLLKRMPFTTFVTVIGMISMLLPPFGVLMTKWIAIETSVHLPVVLFMLILGSAFTVVFWAKWIGIILTMSYKPAYVLEKLPASVGATLSVLLIGVAGASFGIAPLFNFLVAPYLNAAGFSNAHRLAADSTGLQIFANGGLVAGGVAAIPLFIIVFALVLAVPYCFRLTRRERIKPPYFGGELAHNDVRGIDFIGPGDKVEQVIVHNYYLAGIFGEQTLTVGLGVVAAAIILIMFGVVI